MSITLYHNPRCSKSRSALELIRKNGIEPVIIEYLKTPPDPDDLESLIKASGMSARDFIRPSEPVYKALGLQDQSLTESDLILAMTKNPILIERPIAIAGNRVVIGRPPENILALIP